MKNHKFEWIWTIAILIVASLVITATCVIPGVSAHAILFTIAGVVVCATIPIALIWE